MSPKAQDIDLEWAQMIVGIRLKVPDRWWNEYTIGTLNNNRIVSFDASKQMLQFLLDNPQWGIHPYDMAYKPIYLYANEEASTYPLFRLPQDAPTRQEVEVVVAREKHYVRTNVEDWEKIDVLGMVLLEGK